MTMPFYVSPEQSMKDKADYARKGIARGRSVVVLQYDDGILFMTENPSRSLYKISEIYDRIAFAAVGRYNEFEALRVAGVRAADIEGIRYDRRDVTGRFLANAYAQTLGAIFTESPKPYEIEIVVAEVNEDSAADQLYRLTFDGSVADEHGFVAMGGAAEQLTRVLRERYREGMGLPEALSTGAYVLANAHQGDPSAQSGQQGQQGQQSQQSQQPAQSGQQGRELSADQLEVAVLDRTRAKRKFRRIVGRHLADLLASGPTIEVRQADAAGSAESGDAAGSGGTEPDRDTGGDSEAGSQDGQRSDG